jgi:glutamine amidotransferase
MWELFCLSSRHPTRTTFSLRHFATHGAPDTRNIDGWSVAFHDGHDARLYKEPEPAGDSPLLGFIERHRHPTHLLISHIRRATVGGNNLANTQPFVRELGGRVHLFAHNGGFHGIEALFARSVHRFHLVGEGATARGAACRRQSLRRRDAAARHRQLPLQRRRVRLRPRPSPHAGRRYRAAAEPPGAASPAPRWPSPR